MKIRVKDIKTEGLDLVDKIQPGTVGLSDEEDLKFTALLEVTAHITRVANNVFAKTHIKTKYASFCARCLESIEDDWLQDFDFNFAIEKTTEYIDLGEDIRQEMLLNFPKRLLCKEDCKGLCMDCGVNLNHEQCKCKK